ncbi:ATP-binding protein [Kitasatospora sp. NPDC048239]|uniref:ATP-binding protein n=1 Tax=Kitasatospora sp. NPDC048239 TaxID=3364046 RepID=UPI003721798F
MRTGLGAADGHCCDVGPRPAGRRRRLPLAGLPTPVTRARAFTRQALADWSWPAPQDGAGPAVVHDVVLLVAELVANAVVHGGGPLELVLDASAERLRIEVSDGGAALPEPRLPHRPGRAGGHGLFIVQRAADRWGAARHARGKAVWAEVDARRPAPAG